MKNEKELRYSDEHVEKVWQAVDVAVARVASQHFALVAVCKLVNCVFESRQLLVELAYPIRDGVGPERVANLDFPTAAATSANCAVVESNAEVVEILNDLQLPFLRADFIEIFHQTMTGFPHLDLTTSSVLMLARLVRQFVLLNQPGNGAGDFFCAAIGDEKTRDSRAEMGRVFWLHLHLGRPIRPRFERPGRLRAHVHQSFAARC